MQFSLYKGDSFESCQRPKCYIPTLKLVCTYYPLLILTKLNFGMGGGSSTIFVIDFVSKQLTKLLPNSYLTFISNTYILALTNIWTEMPVIIFVAI